MRWHYLRYINFQTRSGWSIYKRAHSDGHFYFAQVTRLQYWKNVIVGI